MRCVPYRFKLSFFVWFGGFNPFGDVDIAPFELDDDEAEVEEGEDDDDPNEHPGDDDTWNNPQIHQLKNSVEIKNGLECRGYV